MEVAEELGYPLWMGEFGVGSAAYRAGHWTRDAVDLFDEYALGWAWWCYWRDKASFGLLYPDGREKTHIVKHLDRPYVFLCDGCRPLSFKFDGSKFVARLWVVRNQLRAYVYVPYRHFGELKGLVASVDRGVVRWRAIEERRTVVVEIDGVSGGTTVEVYIYRGG